MNADIVQSHAPLRWIHKLLLAVSLTLGAGLFLSVGWMAIAPDDPLGAVSMLTHSRPVLMILEAAAVSAATAALATLLVGWRLPDAGTFATALGLALVMLQGGTAEYLFQYVLEGDRSGEPQLAGRLAVEGLLWFVVVLVAMLVSGLVLQWCLGVRGPSDGRLQAGASVRIEDMAANDCPILNRMLFPAGCSASTPLLHGLRQTGMVAVVALLLFALLAAGSSPRTIQHGQICFATFAAFFLAQWVAKTVFPSRTAFWGILAVVIVCATAYMCAMLRGSADAPYNRLANIPSSVFFRSLPIGYISVGTLGVLVAHWTVSGSSGDDKQSTSTGRARSRQRT